MDNTVLMIAIASTLVFAGHLLFSSIFGDHHHSDVDAGIPGDSFGVLQFFSIQSLLLAIMSFSWHWLFWTKNFSGLIFPAIASLFSGSAMVLLYVYGMRSLRKLNTPDKIDDFKPEVGMHASVYSTIPSVGAGHGVVTVLCAKRGDFELPAVSLDDRPIPTGEKVVIAELNLPSHVIVRRA